MLKEILRFIEIQKGNEIRSYIHVRDVAKIVYNSTSKKVKTVTIIYLETKKPQLKIC